MTDSGCRWLVLIAFLASAPRAGAESPRSPSNGVAPGYGWYCVTVHEEFDPRDRGASCFRALETCERMRDRMGEDDGSAPTIVGDCIAQRKAAVVTYFDTMNDATTSWALPSTELCQETRRAVQRNPDNRRVSACQLFGDLPFPAGPFQAARVEPGAGWYCSAGSQRVHACARTREACEAMGGTRCAPQPKAVAVTWTPSSEADEGLDRATGASWDGVAVFRNSGDCARLRALVSVRRTDTSPCTPVGAVGGPPADRARIAEGASWACARDGAVSTGQVPDTCYRALASCRDIFGDDACEPSATAFVTTTVDTYFAFATRAPCEQYAARVPGASRCEVVGAVGDRAPPAPAVAVAESLDRAMISDGVNLVKPRILDCGLRFEAHGTVKVAVRVGPDGRVEDVVLKTSPDPQLGACVGTAIREARFAPTRGGGSFGYPFVF